MANSVMPSVMSKPPITEGGEEESETSFPWTDNSAPTNLDFLMRMLLLSRPKVFTV